MLRFTKMTGILAAGVLALMWAVPAQAQASRTWISGVGDDVNPCSRTAPCKTFAGAISKTAAGGEIDCLDPAGYGAVTVTKSITLDCGGGMGGQVGSILASGSNGITVFAGGTDKVKVRNMTINGFNGLGISGIRFNTGQSLIVEHVGIFGFGAVGNSPAVAGAGIDFDPQVAGSRLFTRDVEVQNNLASGIMVHPVSGVAGTALINNTAMMNNAVGITVNDGGVVTVVNSQMSGNNKGALAQVTTVALTLNLDGDTISSNGVFGLQTAGAGATVTLSNNGIYNNTTNGINAGAGTTVNSFGNNRMGTNAGNANAGTITTLSPALQ